MKCNKELNTLINKKHKIMPAGDRTGSMGQGPRSGRGLGYCSGFDSPGYAKRQGGAMGRGFGFGRGHGRGIGRGKGYGRGWDVQASPWANTTSKEDEIKLLKSQADELKRTQTNIEKRLTELEK